MLAVRPVSRGACGWSCYVYRGLVVVVVVAHAELAHGMNYVPLGRRFSLGSFSLRRRQVALTVTSIERSLHPFFRIRVTTFLVVVDERAVLPLSRA